MSKFILLLILGLPLSVQGFLVPTNSVPAVQLAWNGVGGATNYFMYYGVASGGYTNKTSVGAVTNCLVSLPARGVKYFFAVTDVDGNGLESIFSNEANYTPPVPLAAPVLGPVVVLTVQKGASASGLFADTPMSWSLSALEGAQFYRVKVALR